ncbi:hypothetical protein [Kribbia dieselivorans]|uniref:hypothetical protein n=1 Tax=Kribbia dieselivorans TaxID=331526 RepID=UPI0008386238|nr:hypothetical protein [Kribbia dieselivorans]
MNIFFIKLGGNSGFVVTEYSDGSVKMTATNGAGIGVEFPPGAGAEAGGKKGGASVDFGGGLEYGWGSTWNFSSMAEAEAFRKQFDAYRNQWPWENKPAPRPPDETVTSIKVNAEVEGELGIGAGKGKANVEGSGTWTTRTKVDQTPDNGKDDTLTTYTTDLSIKGGAEGNIVNITFVSTAEGSLKGGQKGKVESTKPKGSAGSKGSAEVGKAVVVTTSLDFDPNDPKSQQIVKDWLGGDNPNHANPLDVVSAPFINPTEKVDGDPFQNLLYERAQVSTVEYDKVKDTQGFAAEVKLGVKLGFDFSLEKSEATAVNATYLGAPDPDGVRRPVPYTSCITGAGGTGGGM